MYDDSPYESYEPQKRPPKNVFAAAAVVFGILSLVFSMLIYLALPCGALAVILAILSHTDKPMIKKAKLGLICGIAGMTATIVLTVSAFYVVLSDSGMRSMVEYYCQIYIGDSDFDLDELIEDMFPFIKLPETPSIELPGTEHDTPFVIEPKGEGTFL